MKYIESIRIKPHFERYYKDFSSAYRDWWYNISTRCRVWRSSQDYGCCCGRLVPELNESCVSSLDRAKIGCVVPSRFCCRCPRVCKKAARCETPPCTMNVRSCGGGGCCGCGKPSQICTPSPRICNSPAHSSRAKSPCAPRYPLQCPCSVSGCRDCCSGSNRCGRCDLRRLLNRVSQCQYSFDCRIFFQLLWNWIYLWYLYATIYWMLTETKMKKIERYTAYKKLLSCSALC